MAISFVPAHSKSSCMSFDDLPGQPPIYPPEAEAYARQALAQSRRAQERIDGRFDIPYGADYWQKVDVYVPEGKPDGLLPVLVFAHGGAWTHGYKEWCGLMAPALTASGVVFVSVSYRLAPAHRFPVPLEDCALALKWVIDNIKDYGGDPDRISVGGHSAGGHLFALLALRHDVLQANGIELSAIKACFPVSSQLNLVFDSPEPGTGEARIYEMFLADPRDSAQASPLHLAGNRRTPFFLSYGSDDFPRIKTSNELMAQALARQGGGLHVDVLDGFRHFDTALIFSEESHPWVERFIERVKDAGPRA